MKRQLLLNSIASLFQKAVLSLRHIILVPFFLMAWGGEIYGDWLMLSAIPMTLLLCNMGVGTAASNTFVLRYISGDVRGAHRAMRTGSVLVWVSVAVGMSVVTASIIIFNNLGTFARLSVDKDMAWMSVLILSLSALVSFFPQLSEGWYRAARKAHLSVHLGTTVEIMRVFLVLIALIFHQSMVVIASIELSCNVFKSAWMQLAGKKLVLGIDRQIPVFSSSDFFEFSVKGVGYMLNSLRQAIHNQGTILVLRFFLGAASVSVFGTLKSLSNALTQIYSFVNSSVFPELQHAIAARRMEDARKIFRLAIGVSVVSSFIGGGLLSVFGPSLYRVWTADALEISDSVWPLLIIGVMINAVSWSAGATFRASNNPGIVGIVGVFASIVGVAITAVFVNILGVNSALLGIIVMEFVLACYILPVSCKMLEQSFLRLPIDILESRHLIYKSLRFNSK